MMLLCFCFAAAKSQSYYFRHYQVEAGLSNNTVFCTVQDGAGFLWFGTKEGLNRFDGYHFKIFKLDTSAQASLTPDRIYCLLNDDKGTLWVGSQKGLYYFDAATERLVQRAGAFAEISSLQTDKAGRLWFTSNAGLCRYDMTADKITCFSPSVYFNATSVCRTADGTIWAATRDGYLKKFDAATETFASYDVFAHSPAAASRFIQKIYSTGKDSIFIGTSSQGLKLFQIPIAEYTDLLTHNANKTSVFVRDMLVYQPGEFWFATESGIFILNTKTGRFTNLKKRTLDPYSLSDNAVYALCKDREGGVWAGTYFGGVNYYPKQYTPFRKYFPDYSNNSISGSVVREICADRFGNLWIGTEDGGLNKLTKKTGVITRFSPTGARGSIAYSNIHGLLADSNELWIGTFEHGLDVMDIRTGKVKKRYWAGKRNNQLKSNFVVSFLKTTTGNIFLGTSNGLYQYHKKTNGFTPIALAQEAPFISCLLEAKDKTIWIGTHGGGVHYFNPVTKAHGFFKNIPEQPNSLSNNQINAICEDRNQNLWFATEGGGLCKLLPGRKQFIRYTTNTGLPGNFVFKVLEDAAGKLWVSTSKGLARLDTESGETTVYTKAAGLLNNQFNYNSGYKDSDGTLYFGSVDGMIAFQPETFRQRQTAVPLFITGFQVNGNELKPAEAHGVLKKSVLYASSVTLPYNQSSFSIDVAALSYTAPEMTTYRYQMKGLNNEPTFIKSNHKIYFTNLAPGRYTFCVAAAVNGRKTGAGKNLQITILPPFWATTAAYVLYAALGLALLYYLVRSYHTHLEDKKEKELYEAKLDFFTNITHEIKTPLTLIKGPLENVLELSGGFPELQADVRTMERATDRLLSLINQILDFRKAELKRFSLDFEKVNLTKLLQEELAVFMPLAKKRRLSCALYLPPADVVAVADADALQKILSNLLSNAVKYATGELTIRLYAPKNEEGTIQLEIANDGHLIPAAMHERIFEPFYTLKEGPRHKGTGIGLALARSLAELHGGKLFLKEARNGFNTFVLLLPAKPLRGSHPHDPKNTQIQPENRLN